MNGYLTCQKDVVCEIFWLLSFTGYLFSLQIQPETESVMKFIMEYPFVISANMHGLYYSSTNSFTKTKMQVLDFTCDSLIFRFRHTLVAERFKTLRFRFRLDTWTVISKRYVFSLRWWPGGQLPLWWEQEPHQPNRVLRVTWRHHFPSPGSQLCREPPGNVWSKKVSKKEIILIN